MPRYEYKVVPAPTKGLKGKGVKGAEARFSHAIQELMNGLAGYGWEYQRAETLPSVERSGLTSTTTEWRNVLVFRRLRENDAEAFAPELLPAPETVALPEKMPDEPAPGPSSNEMPEEVTPAEETLKEATSQDTSEAKPEAKTQTSDAASEPEEAWDNGVEDTSDVKGVGATLETLAAVRKSDKTDA